MQQPPLSAHTLEVSLRSARSLEGSSVFFSYLIPQMNLAKLN